jgi:hypothetical protein
MKLFTQEIDRKLFSQYNLGSDLSKQMVVAKIFNPYGAGRWFLINSDSQDPDYLWAIVDLFDIEVGSVSRTELQSIRIGKHGLPLERDLYFKPINAQELLNGLMQGQYYKKGGLVHNQNKEMLENQAKEFMHHSKELNSLVGKTKDVDAWVIAKAERATTDLSDITHYLEGRMEQGGMMAKGAIVNQYKDRSAEDIWNNLEKEQRQHFLYDHKEEIQDYRGSEYGELKSQEIIKAYNSNWKDLDKNIRNRFDNHVREGQYEDGGMMNDEEGIDLFEDYNNIPPKVQKVLDEHEEDLEYGDYRVLEKILKKLNKIGYTFEYGLDGVAYDLRPIGTKGKSEFMDEFAMGGATFDDKVKAISKRLEGTKVPTRLKKDYGATYNKKEAKQAGQRIAGSMIKKLKMKYK